MNIYDHYVITNKREIANVLKYLEYIDSERTNNNINRYNLNLIFSIKDYLIHYNEQKMNNKYNINLINILYIKTIIKFHKVYIKNNCKYYHMMSNLQSVIRRTEGNNYVETSNNIYGY